MGEIIFTTHLRSVAGVFVLSAGLLIAIGGGAIATADTESAAATSTQSADGSSAGAGTTGTAGTAEAQPTAEQLAGQGETGGGSTEVPAPGEVGVTTTDPATDPSASEADYEKKWTESTTSESDTSGSGSASTTNSTPEPGPSVLASDSNVPASDTNVAAANSTVATSNSNVVPPVTTTVSPLMNAIQPVTNAITTLANVVNSVPTKIAALPTSTTPVIDVITTVQEMLSQVAGAVIPLAQVPSDLYSLLGIPQTPRPLIGEGGVSAFTVKGAAPLFGPRAAQFPVAMPSASLEGSLFGTVPPPPILGTVAKAGLYQQLSLSGMAQLAPEGIRPMNARSLFEHMVSAVLVPASLTALAALALPGIGGLLVISAAGIRVGYRQAKAGLALRAAGIARFAGSGPLGVVRTGSLIVLHTRTPRASRPRTLRAVRPEAAATNHLEQVA
jgi:hypothetical protein